MAFPACTKLPVLYDTSINNSNASLALGEFIKLKQFIELLIFVKLILSSLI